jgi:hypothetical protein
MEKELKKRGRKARRTLKVQLTLNAAEIDSYEEKGSDPLFIRYAVRKAADLCLHNAVTEEDGIPICFFCKETNPENFSKFIKNTEGSQAKKINVVKVKSNIL